MPWLDWLFQWNGYCTLWFDRILWWDWSMCCAQHDFDYTVGVLKALADAKLKACVNGVLNGMGNVMAWGVATFGGLWYAMARARRSNGK